MPVQLQDVISQVMISQVMILQAMMSIAAQRLEYLHQMNSMKMIAMMKKYQTNQQRLRQRMRHIHNIKGKCTTLIASVNIMHRKHSRKND
jgi:hypothetical protein